MRLTRLRLNQICQHRQLDWQFRNGLLGVFGPNGSGKSNALNVGCYAGFTGDYARHIQGKEGMIRQQAGASENVSIRLNFTQDGHEFELMRSLRSPVKNTLRLPDGRQLTKVNEIQAHLNDVLGISKQLIDHFVFVSQGNLFGFLDDVPETRSKAFAHLCDTVKAERIWELLGAGIQADSGLAMSVVDNRDEIRQALGGYKQRLDLADAEAAEARQGLLTREAKAVADRVIANWNSYQSAVLMLDEAQSRSERQATAAVEAYELVQPLEEAVAALEQDCHGHPARLQELAADLRNYANLQARWKQRQTLEAELKNFPAAPAAPVDPEVDVVVVQARIDEMSEEFHGYRQLVKNVDGVPICPTCGQSTESLADAVEHAHQALVPLEQALNKCRAQLQAAEDYRVAHARWESAARTREQRLKEKKELLLTLADATAPDDPSELQAEQARLNKELGWLREKQQALQQALSRYNKVKGAADEAAHQVEVWQTKVNGFVVTEADAKAAQEQLDGHTMANRLLAAAQAKQTELQNFIQQQEAELTRVGTLLERSANARHMLDTWQAVRDCVMHRDKLPRLVHQSYLRRMEADINETLQLFGSPFRITTTDDLSFTARFLNGTVMPAGGLSGGQKVMLAMAFRMTVNSLFAPQVGMMVLDEPTDGLDADNRALAAEVFRRLGELARSRGHQVIIVTHDEALRTVFDQVFTLERAA